LFFYDGGRDSRVTRAEVEHTLDGITTLIRKENPDVVLLQEVDRNSSRTHHIDQHRHLVRRLGYPTHLTTPYFKVPYVPVPPHAPMGKVDMHLSVLSRYALGAGRRFALSPLDEPRWRRAFNLRRALLQVSLGRAGGPDLQLFLTHLSAFSRGDGTLARQVRTLVDRTAAAAGPCLLAGDLNSLPPGDSPARLGGAEVLYSESATPIQPLFDALTPISPPPDALLDPAYRSYVPYGSNRADRTIDYVFGRGISADRVRTVVEGAEWSDHLPIVADFFIEDSNASTASAVTAVPC
jgi:endonuclease/exonuclease/phosphatase family metal-dependent hydrolase